MKQIVAVAGVIRKAGRILITKRLANAPIGPGKWEFPGGKLEPNESLERCLVREIKEELGIKIGNMKLFDAFTYMHGEEFQIILVVFTAQLSSGTPKKIGCSEFKWVKANELENHEFLSSNKALIRKLQSPS
ncbi:(deoxy)nucleoside triphosphate pyrophosphohydrolase [Candidatus Woesearchaeota archaeon]|nr:(deoxy)nucleoside triphosphate pyrophosphohydrolase [Candidatus Woesearchaeota archaeon]